MENNDYTHTVSCDRDTAVAVYTPVRDNETNTNIKEIKIKIEKSFVITPLYILLFLNLIFLIIALLLFY